MKCVSYSSLLNNNICIIDMQNPVSYKANHFYGAVNMSYDYILENYNMLFNKQKVYYFYCPSGKLSKRVVSILSSLGYNAYVLID